MADEKRQERFAVRLSPAEAEMVARLADADGVSRSDAVRMCVRAVYAERQTPLGGGCRAPDAAVGCAGGWRVR